MKRRTRARLYYHENKKEVIERRTQKKYGLSPEGRARLLEFQQRRCGACKREIPLVVDHNHRTGGVRGLLCEMCNKGVGFLQDSPEVLAAAIQYLQNPPFQQIKGEQQSA